MIIFLSSISVDVGQILLLTIYMCKHVTPVQKYRIFISAHFGHLE